MFIPALINYIDEFTKFNVKELKINNTIFVVDQSFYKYSCYDDEDMMTFIKNNIEIFTFESKVSFNYVQFLSLLSVKPLFFSIETMFELLRHLFNKDLIAVRNLCFSDLAKVIADNHPDIKPYSKIRFNMHFNTNIIFNFIFLLCEAKKQEILIVYY